MCQRVPTNYAGGPPDPALRISYSDSMGEVGISGVNIYQNCKIIVQHYTSIVLSFVLRSNLWFSYFG
jgi:hypothetical protein